MKPKSEQNNLALHWFTTHNFHWGVVVLVQNISLVPFVSNELPIAPHSTFSLHPHIELDTKSG